MTKIISVVSSMPMAGKTALCMNLGVQLADQNFRTCLFSNTTELSRLDNVFGLHPQKDLKAINTAGAGLKDIILSDFYGIDILPGCYDDERLMNAGIGIKKLAESNLDIESYDFFIIDNSAGTDAQVAASSLAATETLLVINPTIEVITDAVNFLGHLQSHGYRDPVGVVINQCSNFQFGRLALSKLTESVKSLNLQGITPYGIILQDPQLKEALTNHRPLCIGNDEAVFCRGVAELAEKVIGLAPHEKHNTSIPTFLQDYLSRLQNGSSAAAAPPSLSDAVPGLENSWVSHPPEDRAETALSESSSENLGSLNQSLNNMARSLNRITRELRQIRFLIERHDQSTTAKTAPKANQETRIALDFDNFISSQQDQ
jgi:MinD-like ATPase involved in chromosome partitioning or flagellar assembly